MSETITFKLKYLTLFVLFSIAAHFMTDLFHFPIYLDKIGIFLAALVLGPFYALLAGIFLGLSVASINPFWVILFFIPGIVGLFWGFSLKSGLEQSMFKHVLWAIIGGALFAGIYFIMFSLLMYNPLVEHVLPYTRIFNEFTLQFIDAIICYFVGFLIYVVYTNYIHVEQNKMIKILPIIFIIIGAAITFPARFGVVAEDTMLVPNFPKPAGYIFTNVRMDVVWAPLGLRGTNNYLYPVQRFNRSDPGYQVWFGVYWVQGRYGIYGDQYVMNEILAFSILDQNTWISLHGYHTPKTTVHHVDGVAWGTFDGYPALFMNGSYDTQSDVYPYEDVTLQGFQIVLYIPKLDRTAIIYACSTMDNWGVMGPELWNLAYQLDFP